jgi:hypothetical protein
MSLSSEEGSVRHDVVFDAFGHLRFPAVAPVLQDCGAMVTTPSK